MKKSEFSRDDYLDLRIYFLLRIYNGMTAIELSELLLEEKSEINSVLYKNKYNLFVKGDFLKWYLIEKHDDNSPEINNMINFISSIVRNDPEHFSIVRKETKYYLSAFVFLENFIFEFTQYIFYLNVGIFSSKKLSEKELRLEFEKKYHDFLFVEILGESIIEDLDYTNSLEKLIDSKLFHNFIEVMKVLIDYDQKHNTNNIDLFLYYLDRVLTESICNNYYYKEDLSYLYEFIENLKLETKYIKDEFSECSICGIRLNSFKMEYRISQEVINKTWALCPKCVANYDFEHNKDLLHAIFGNKKETHE